jgi:hypothetical protein
LPLKNVWEALDWQGKCDVVSEYLYIVVKFGKEDE